MNKTETDSDAETDGWLPGEEGRGLDKRDREGKRQYRLVTAEQSRDVKYRAGNRVNNIVITVCGVRSVLKI